VFDSIINLLFDNFRINISNKRQIYFGLALIIGLTLLLIGLIKSYSLSLKRNKTIFLLVKSSMLVMSSMSVMMLLEIISSCFEKVW